MGEMNQIMGAMAAMGMNMDQMGAGGNEEDDPELAAAIAASLAEVQAPS